MRRLSESEIERVLRSRHVPGPPPGLADRIKADIPEYIEVGGRPPAAGGRRGSLRLLTIRPLWLLAASLLIVIGVGFAAARLWQPGRNLARDIALDGVAVPDAYEIVVPPRWGAVHTPQPSPDATPTSEPAPGRTL
jgi:hypothetical protein